MKTIKFYLYRNYFLFCWFVLIYISPHLSLPINILSSKLCFKNCYRLPVFVNYELIRLYGYNDIFLNNMVRFRPRSIVITIILKILHMLNLLILLIVNFNSIFVYCIIYNSNF